MLDDYSDLGQNRLYTHECALMQETLSLNPEYSYKIDKVCNERWWSKSSYQLANVNENFCQHIQLH